MAETRMLGRRASTLLLALPCVQVPPVAQAHGGQPCARVGAAAVIRAAALLIPVAFRHTLSASAATALRVSLTPAVHCALKSAQALTR